MGHFFTTRMEWPIPFILAEMKLSIFIPARIKWSIRVLERNPERHCSEVMQPGRAQPGKTTYPFLFIPERRKNTFLLFAFLGVANVFEGLDYSRKRVLEDPKVPYYS